MHSVLDLDGALVLYTHDVYTVLVPIPFVLLVIVAGTCLVSVARM